MKHKEVLTLQAYDAWGYVGYAAPVQPGMGIRPFAVRVPEPLWLDMGKPDTVTVTVEPGEKRSRKNG